MSEHNDEHDTSVDDADAHPIVPPPAHLARARASPDDVRDALPGDRERAAFDELLARTEELSLTPLQRLWLDARAVRRYLVARQFKVDAAFELLRTSLEWRNKRGVWNLRPERDDVLHFEMSSGKMYRNGKDRKGRPLGYIRDRRANSKDYVGQVDCVINLLERMIDSMDESAGVEQWVLIFDFRGYSNANRPPFAMCREVLDVFMNQYPERLGHAYMLNAPWLFNWAYSALAPFIPSETKAKIDFVSGEPDALRRRLEEAISPEHIEAMFGGDDNCEYVHRIYWQEELEQVRRVQSHREAMANGEDISFEDETPKKASSKRRVRKKKSSVVNVDENKDVSEK